jgi:hypothetical protein
VLGSEIPTSATRSAGTRRRLVLVAGAGRSGTSAVAGIMQRLGLVVPTPEVVTDETNPKGFSESQWVVDFHDDLLFHAVVQVGDGRPEAWHRTGVFAERPGATRLLKRWLDEQLDHYDQLVIKDPRLSWFLSLWTSVARDLGVDPVFVTMLRPPAEIVGSKRTYYNNRLQDASGIASWLNMLLGTELATRESARAFVRYHDLLEQWEPVTTTIGRALELPALAELTDEKRAAVDGFVDPTLRRVELTWDDLALPPRLEEMARSAWDALDALADPHPDVAALTDRLDATRAAYAEYYRESEQVSRSSAIAARDRMVRQIRLSPDTDAAEAAAIAVAADASQDAGATDSVDTSDVTDVADATDAAEDVDEVDEMEHGEEPDAEPGRTAGNPPSLRRLASARARALVKAALDRGARPSAG